MHIPLRCPEDAPALIRLIRQTANAKQRDRYRAVELAIAGHATLEIQRMLGRSRGFVQRWCYAYRDHGLDAVKPTPPPGRPPLLPVEQHAAFKRRVLDGPIPGADGDGVCTLRGRDFQRILKEEFGVSYALNGVYDLLHRLNLSVLVPRPQHRKSDPEAHKRWVRDAPFLSSVSGGDTPTSVSPSGSRTKPESASRAR